MSEEKSSQVVILGIVGLVAIVGLLLLFAGGIGGGAHAVTGAEITQCTDQFALCQQTCNPPNPGCTQACVSALRACLGVPIPH